MHALVAQTADELWRAAIGYTILYGTKHDSRVGASHEVLGWSGKLLKPEANFVFNTRRKLSPYYAAGELMWYLSGTDDASFIRVFAPRYVNYLDDGVHANGAYGKRWINQLPNIIKLLREKPDTRQAILQTWNEGDLALITHASSKDVPCTTSLQFIARKGCLHLVVTMRSNDVWLGMPYDVFCFTSLQAIIATELGLAVGTYTHNVGSLHIYEKDLQACAEAHKECMFKQIDSYQTVVPPQHVHEPYLHTLGVARDLISASSGPFLRRNQDLSLVSSLENLCVAWLYKDEERLGRVYPSLRVMAEKFPLKKEGET